MIYDVTVNETERRIDVKRHPEGGWWVSVDGGEARHITGGAVGRAEWRLIEGIESRTFGMYCTGGQSYLQLRGRSWRPQVVDPRRAALELGDGSQEGVIATQMPGAVVRVPVAVGDVVSQGQVVVVVEAMKMENEFKSPCDGTVASISVQAGQNVDAGTTLVVIEPA